MLCANMHTYNIKGHTHVKNTIINKQKTHLLNFFSYNMISIVCVFKNNYDARIVLPDVYISAGIFYKIKKGFTNNIIALYH